MTYQLIHGSAHDIPVPDKSVHAIVCSPPYYGLRAYEGDQAIEWSTVEYAPMVGLAPIRVQGCELGCEHEWGNDLLQREQSGRHRLKWETGGNPAAKVPSGAVSQGAYCTHCGGWRGGLGLEPTIEMYIGHLILCLREWHRVLRDDGIAWVNLGDSYNGSGGAGGDYNAGGSKEGQPRYPGRRINGLKPKDLCMIPARFALAAQADGWYLRSAIVWAKGVSFIPHYAGSCMPESVTDRPTQSYEMVYMLAKQEKYYFDMESVKESLRFPDAADGSRIFGGSNKNGANLDHARTTGRVYEQSPSGRNLRSVWAINPQPYSGPSETSHLEPVARDAVSYGMMRRVSLNCPTHGDQDRQYDERAGGASYRTVGKYVYHVLAQPTEPSSSLQYHDELSSGCSSDYSDHSYSLFAIDHSTQNHKKGRAPETIQPYMVCDENHDHIADTSIKPEWTSSGDRIQLSNNCEGDLGAHLLAQTLSRTVDNSSYIVPPECTCKFYHETTKKANHFACWPEALVTPMIKASTSAHGVCAKCGAPWKRIVEKEYHNRRPNSRKDGIQFPSEAGAAHTNGKGKTTLTHEITAITIGWQPTCQCACDEVIPATVIDPFNGSGTSGRAALKLGRSYIGVDISKQYLEDLSPERMSNVQMELLK